MSSSRRGHIRSPNRREALNEELNEHTQRIRDLMVADLTFLEEQNTALRMKCQKVEELQQKVTLVLRNNEELYSENQKLALLVEQKIAQCDHLRLRAESRRNYESNHQYEKTRLIGEIEELRHQISQIEHIKNLTISEIRNKHDIEMKNLIDDHEADMKAYDEQLIKIRDSLQTKDKSLSSLNQKMKEKQEQFEKQNKKREEENKVKVEEYQKKIGQKTKQLEEKMKQVQENKGLQQKYSEMVNQLQQQVKVLQEKHKQAVAELEEGKEKIEQQFKQKISNLQTNNEELDTKNESLKDQVYRMRRQNEGLKNQIKELNFLNDQQVKTLKQRLDQFHDAEVEEIHATHLNHKGYLERQLLNMQQQLKEKEIQLKMIAEDKLVMRDQFIAQGKQIKEDFKMLQYEFKLAEDKSKEQINRLSQDLIDSQIRFKELQDDFNEKTKQYSEIVQNHTELKNKLNSLQKTYEEKEMRLKESINDWKDSFFNSKAEIQKLRQEWEDEKNKLNKEKQDLITKYQGLLKKNRQQYQKLERQNQSLKEFIGNRDKGIDDLIDKITHLNKMIEQKDEKIEKLRDQLLDNAKKNTQKIGQMKKTHDKSLKQKLRYVTQDFQTRNSILETNLDIALKELKAKQGQLQQLVRQYELMRSQMLALTDQEAKKKDISLKFSGATADLIASKNMFDVFVKGKVLQTCSDVLDKQNRADHL